MTGNNIGRILNLKLVCFANNTGGGLVCDLLNRQSNSMRGYKTTGIEHSAFKIGDSPTIYTNIDTDLWNQRVLKYSQSTSWFGTHTHPTVIPNLSQFDKVLAITTSSRKSKLYRWLRLYHGWFVNTFPDWKESDSIYSIDKIKELAKNVFAEFTPHPSCINVEFEDIVNGEFVKQYRLNTEYFNYWASNNRWLYQDEESWAVRRFNEAEFELNSGVPFKYF